ncbi:VOC family protein [Anaerocolumna chitinilytica]|nr:hypothetical protein [Anaerocolumna chitinilytica]
MKVGLQAYVKGSILIPLGALPWSSCCANVMDKYGIFWYISV